MSTLSSVTANKFVHYVAFINSSSTFTYHLVWQIFFRNLDRLLLVCFMSTAGSQSLLSTFQITDMDGSKCHFSFCNGEQYQCQWQ